MQHVPFANRPEIVNYTRKQLKASTSAYRSGKRGIAYDIIAIEFNKCYLGINNEFDIATALRMLRLMTCQARRIQCPRLAQDILNFQYAIIRNPHFCDASNWILSPIN
jgi:hypothetical protein